jgi:hypothetical protein
MAEMTRLSFMPQTLAAYRLRSDSSSHREEMLRDVFALIGKIRARWPQSAAQMEEHEKDAHLMYGRFLAAQGRSAEAQAHLLAAGVAPAAGLLSRLKNVIGW